MVSVRNVTVIKAYFEMAFILKGMLEKIAVLTTASSTKWHFYY